MNMKFIYTIVALVITATAFAQNPVTKDVGDFTEVKVYDRIVVNLVKSTENKVIITGRCKPSQCGKQRRNVKD